MALAGCSFTLSSGDGVDIEDVGGEFQDHGEYVVDVEVENNENSIETVTIEATILIQDDRERTQTDEVSLSSESSETLEFLFTGLSEDLDDDNIEYGAEIVDSSNAENNEQQEREDVDSPTYELGSEDKLLPEESDNRWPDPELVANHDLNDLPRNWVGPNETIIVAMDTSVFEDSEVAEEAFQQWDSSLLDAETYQLADEAVVGDELSEDGKWTHCVFRHDNALGKATAAFVSEGTFFADRERATAYAEVLFNHWVDMK